MAESIRVDRGIRRIEVNDDGEYIEVTVNDPNLFSNFAKFLKWLSDKQEDLEKFKEDNRINITPETSPEDIDIEQISALAQNNVKLCKETCGQLDMLFGEGCCKKVFGSILPDENCIADFLEQITPIIQRMADERSENIQLRYDRNRKGGRSIPDNRQNRRNKNHRR